jgi:hypothetical protein
MNLMNVKRKLLRLDRLRSLRQPLGVKHLWAQPRGRRMLQEMHVKVAEAVAREPIQLLVIQSFSTNALVS